MPPPARSEGPQRYGSCSSCEGTSLFGPPRRSTPTRPCANTVKLSIGMVGIEDGTAEVAVEVVSSASDRAEVDRRVRQPRRLYPAMGAKIGIAHEQIESRRIRRPGRHWSIRGRWGCLGNQT